MDSRFFKVAIEGDVAVVDVQRTRLTEEDNIEEFGQDLVSLMEKHSLSRLVLMMSQVQYLTSSVIGKLIMLHRRMARTEGELVLAELCPEVEEILAASQLLSYFNIGGPSAEGAA